MVSFRASLRDVRRYHKQGHDMSFDDGFRAAEKLVGLFTDMGATEPLDLAPPGQIETVLKTLWARSTKVLPWTSRVVFLHTVTKTGYLTLGIDDFLPHQDDCAPICTFRTMPEFLPSVIGPARVMVMHGVSTSNTIAYAAFSKQWGQSCRSISPRILRRFSKV